MLTVYHAEPIANSVKVLICLFEKDIPFESHYVNLLAFEQHSDDYLAVNPDGLVPAIDHDGAILTESSVINEYLDEAFDGPSLKPADALGRARMRIWTKWCDDYFGPHGSRIGWQFLLHPLARKLGTEAMMEKIARVPMADRQQKWATIAAEGFTPEQIEESRSYLAEGTRRLEAILAVNTWTAGDTYSLSDIATYAVVPGLVRMMPDVVNPEAAPNVMRWLSAMDERPAVKRALAMPNKVFETLRAAGL
ncbi:glutathione S-transferase family protein [Altererythrobacter sp.]|uniref:glutathione S-transferase family protein n=1 Tax=Altererythrobacter sp. TaxID=1872480 RepID=UPI003CFBF049